MRWRFPSRLKSSQILRLRDLITRAAAFWHHLARGLSAIKIHPAQISVRQVQTGKRRSPIHTLLISYSTWMLLIALFQWPLSKAQPPLSIAWISAKRIAWLPPLSVLTPPSEP